MFTKMSGPCIEIISPLNITNSNEAMLWNYINIISDRVEGNDFWVAGQPFLLQYEKVDEEDKYIEVNNKKPESAIIYCSMCNNHASHVILATIAIKTATLMNGLIILEGLSSLTSSKAVLTMSGHTKNEAGDYYVDPEFLKYWLAESDFRLLK